MTALGGGESFFFVVLPIFLWFFLIKMTKSNIHGKVDGLVVLTRQLSGKKRMNKNISLFCLNF